MTAYMDYLQWFIYVQDKREREKTNQPSPGPLPSISSSGSSSLFFGYVSDEDDGGSQILEEERNTVEPRQQSTREENRQVRSTSRLGKVQKYRPQSDMRYQGAEAGSRTTSVPAATSPHPSSPLPPSPQVSSSSSSPLGLPKPPSLRSPLQGVHISGYGLENTPTGELAEFKIQFDDPERARTAIVGITMEDSRRQEQRNIQFEMVPGSGYNVFYTLFQAGKYRITISIDRIHHVVDVRGLRNADYVDTLQCTVDQLMGRLSERSISYSYRLSQYLDL